MPNHPQHDLEHERRVNAAEGEILKHLHALIPKAWQMAMFQVDASTPRADEPQSITHRLRNPMTDQEIFDFSDSLFQATAVLGNLFRQHGQNWKRGLFIFTSLPGGRSEWRTNYLFVQPGGVPR